jgi:replicative DNA helicase
VPPSDLDAESAIIGACLLDVDTFDDVRDMLPPADFYSDANRRVFEAACSVRDAGGTPDVVTVASALKQSGKFDQIGGSTYLATLTDVPTIAHPEQYAQLITQKARQRLVISTAQRIAAEGYGDVGDVEQWSQSCEQLMFEATESRSVRLGAQSVAEVMGAEINQIRQYREKGVQPEGVSTGLIDVDSLIFKLEPGDLYIVAGRPGMGKTAFMLNIAHSVSRRHEDSEGNEVRGALSAFASLEMRKGQIARRSLALEAEVDSNRIRRAELNNDEWIALVSASEKIRKFDLYIDDTPGMTLPQVRSMARKAMRESGLGLSAIFVDYLQLMAGKRERGDSREQEVSSVSQGLKRLAKELHCAVVAGSQLNRSVEQRPNKRPNLADLRESGAIEQDADTIIFLYRDEYYHRDSPDKGVAEAIVAKNRHGATGTVRLQFTPSYTAFHALAKPNDKHFDEIDDYDPDNRYP